MSRNNEISSETLKRFSFLRVVFLFRGRFTFVEERATEVKFIFTKKKKKKIQI